MEVGETKSLAGVRVLVVEDNSINQVVLRHILSNWKVEHTIVSTGTQALSMLKNEDFTIVLMDLQMPEINGYIATSMIRSNEAGVKNPSIPIIALTADSHSETKNKVLEAGMNDLLTKPFSHEALYEKISRLCP